MTVYVMTGCSQRTVSGGPLDTRGGGGGGGVSNGVFLFFKVCSADSAKKSLFSPHMKTNKKFSKLMGKKWFVQQPTKERKTPNTGIKDVSSFH